ncbi:prepilin-type N-terminal cleavage/methylation domain-containing protein [uncultured Sphaerotilus sp.]|uniref:prepilin-type N-terminal cleavage/methylation domain-containing protein n=1 Tax=uncultured Sphaerotilus sp. TaxID=474984 RepID=UPI0030CA1A8B
MRAERARAARGFTLLELLLVIVIGGVMAASLTVFFRPAFDSYLATRNRADLSAQADAALRRLVGEVRLAVPNSVRSPGSQCVEMVPTLTGGRLRMAADTVNDSTPGCTPSASCSAPLDTTALTSALDVLTPLSTVPAVGDWLVIGNQSPNDVYSGSNRAAISTISTPNPAFGLHRLAINPTQFPLGYDGGRFSVVSASQQAVFYVCSGADGSLDANGTARGTLVRLSGYGFNASYPSACPSVAGGQTVLTGLSRCTITYDPNQGATQQNGFVYLQLELTRRNESVSLVVGAHVSNAP